MFNPPDGHNGKDSKGSKTIINLEEQEVHVETLVESLTRQKLAQGITWSSRAVKIKQMKIAPMASRRRSM